MKRRDIYGKVVRGNRRDKEKKREREREGREAIREKQMGR